MNHELYVLLFAITAIICYTSLLFINSFHRDDLRRVLIVFVSSAGTWSALQTIPFVVSDYYLIYWSWILGLIAGLVSVLSWLYFASVFTDNEYHKDPVLKLLTVFFFVVVSMMKLTNHIHGQYAAFNTTDYMIPVLEPSLMYWGTLISVYFVSLLAFGLIVHMFVTQTKVNTWINIALFGIIFVPVISRGVAHITNTILPLYYEPIGIALFIVFITIMSAKPFTILAGFTYTEVLDNIGSGVIIFDEKNNIITHNTKAEKIFPILTQSNVTRDDLTQAHDELIRVSDETVLLPISHTETSGDYDTEYYIVEYDDILFGTNKIGEVVRLKDVTDVEQYRQEVKRHNNQWDEMAGAIAHELRNSVSITTGHLQVARDALANDNTEQAQKSLDVVSRGANNMCETISDLQKFTRYAQTVDHQSTLRIEEEVKKAADLFPSLTVNCVTSGTLEAEQSSFHELLVKTLDYSLFAEATTVNIILKEQMLVIEDNGKYSAHGHNKELFKFESAAPNTNARMRLPLVNTIALSNGWEVIPDCTYYQGLRYEIRSVKTQPDYCPDSNTDTDTDTDTNTGTSAETNETDE